MDIFSAYATDEVKETEGTWVPVGDSELLIARAGNSNYTKMLGKLVERNQKALALKDDAADKLDVKLMIDVMAATVLLDWKNVSYQGEPLEYSKANAKKVLAHKDFRVLVQNLSSDFDAFKIEQEHEEAKN